MKSQLCIILLALTLAACSSSTLVTSNEQRGAISIDQLNQKTQHEVATIFFHDSTTASGSEFRIEHDSASWREIETGNRVIMPITRIHAISTSPNRLAGGLLGFGAGLAAGALIGWRIADGSTSPGADHGLYTLLGTAAGAGAGALMGTVLGVTIAQPNVYEFNTAASGK